MSSLNNVGYEFDNLYIFNNYLIKFYAISLSYIQPCKIVIILSWFPL